MPTDPGVLGFANRWYPLAIDTARHITLPSGAVIRLINGPAFLATKFEAFSDRGQGDLLASHDIEDILTVIASREQLLGEVERSPAELRAYLGRRCRELLAITDFANYLPGLLLDDSSGAMTDKVLERIQTIAEIEV